MLLRLVLHCTSCIRPGCYNRDPNVGPGLCCAQRQREKQCSPSSGVTETPEGHSRDRKRAKGMGESKAKQDAPHSPPSPKGRGSPAQHCAEQTLASRFVPFVAHTGGQEPDSFKFLFYTRHCSNSYSPFYTAQRPTCGYLFHHDTDHTRKVMDIQSANIVKWGPIPTQSYSADQ
ncbi:putative uncharacterized protein GUCA1ANB isoform X1 [Gallus gallus]|nr:putative uncharacterized protein GUCA1ANB isoform X1 [Gallus gallus]